MSKQSYFRMTKQTLGNITNIYQTGNHKGCVAVLFYINPIRALKI